MNTISINERREFELRNRDKTVQKISRDGLIEENLSQGTTQNISQHEPDAPLHSTADQEILTRSTSPPNLKLQPKLNSSTKISDAGTNTPPLTGGDSAFTGDDLTGNSSHVKYKRESKLRDAEARLDKANAKVNNAKKKQPHKKKLKSKLVYDEQTGKSKRKLYFEDQPMSVKPSTLKSSVKKIGTATALQIHRKLHQVERDNVGAEAAHKTELGAETTMRGISHYRKTSSRKLQKKIVKLEKHAAKARANLHYEKVLKKNPELQKHGIKKLLHKRSIKKKYVKQAQKKAKQVKKTAENGVKITSKMIGMIAQHPVVTITIIIILLLVFLVMSLFGAGASMLGQGGLTVLGGTYTASDDAINQAELYYTEKETDLYFQAYALKDQNPGYDEYRYNIGELSHDPYVLMAYLNAVYHDFTFEEIKPKLDILFAEQYRLWTEVSTEIRKTTKIIQVGNSIGTVVTSGYCNCVICTGQWAGGPTASGVMPKSKHTIAVDANHPIVPMGTKIVMGGIEYTVDDTGNFHQYDVDFDIYFDTHAEALAWGHKNLTAYLAEGNVNSVEVTTETEVKIFNINVSTNMLTNLVLSKMNDEQYQMYSLYMISRGNRFYFSPPFNFNWTNYVSDSYGWRIHPISGKKDLHDAVDITTKNGTSVKAVQHGTVTFAGVNGGYGNCVIIEDTEGLKSLYAHLSSILANNGQSITRGDVIGKVGSTGDSTDDHLHLEVFKNNKSLNPFYFVDPGNGNYNGGIPPGDPGTAYDDATFQKLMTEATKYIGYPYVWGGSTPQTSFDCSGYICWVYTQSGVYNLPRTTASGIYNRCSIVSNPKPGDLVFFQGTYDTSSLVTHVGIYVGNGQMLHCGNPIGYTNLNISYWQSHFLAYGRLK